MQVINTLDGQLASVVGIIVHSPDVSTGSWPQERCRRSEQFVIIDVQKESSVIRRTTVQQCRLL